MDRRSPFRAASPNRLASIRLGFLRLFALLLALAFFSSALLIWSTYRYARDQAQRQILNTTRALARGVDGELARYEAGLRGLAVSPSATAGDWRAVDHEARIALQDRYANVIVSDRAGRVLVNTSLPPGSALRTSLPLAGHWPGIDHGDAHVCDLQRDAQGRPFICVQVPIRQNGRAAYVMSAVLSPRVFEPMLTRQRLPINWRASILDSSGTLVWRSRMEASFMGRKVSPRFEAAMRASTEGLLPGTGLEGLAVYVAFSHSPTSGWVIPISAPRNQLDADILPALLTGLAMVAIFLAIGGAISIPWMRRLSSGVEALAAGATALAQREDFERPDIHIRELDEIATAIAGADAILRRRDADLNDLNATLVQRVETALSQRKGALDQLHEARKLESLGQLTGGVAHDFNNLLSPIMGALEMLRIRMGEDAKSVRLIDAALVSSERAKLLVARLLSFSRRQALRPRATDVSALVIDMGDLLRGSLGSPIGLTIDPGVGVDPAHIDPNQLELAILNIAVNARDAMPHGGSLSVIVRQERSEGLGALAPGDYVRISMVDTGVGMDEATRQRAIDPFFTTKPQGKGSGLGLSMVHGLAAQSGGAFVLTSAPGAGTRADIWLPVSMAPRLETSPAPIPSPPQSVRILLVDDEDMVRSGTAEMLRDMGYQVTEASSAAEALEIIRDGASVDCLITDYKMPGMTGAELSLAIRGILPELPIILMTGFAGADVQDLQNIQRLEKPFRQKHLASALQNATGRAAVLS